MSSTKNKRITTDIYEDVLDRLPIGAIIVDDDGIIRRFNRYEEQLSGLSREEVIGKSFFSEVAPCTNDIELGAKFREGIEDNNLDIDIEFSFPYPYNRVARDVRIRAASVGAGDNPANLILIQEITSQRELERNNQTMMQSLRSMLQGGQDDVGTANGTVASDPRRQPGYVEQPSVVLYADLSSYSEAAKQVEPEALFGILDKRIRCAVDAIHRYGGHIDTINGDAVQAYFALEEGKHRRVFYDALRAARDIAADEDGCRFDLPFRVGVAHGTLIRGDLGRDAFARKVTVGHPLSVARKLASLGRPNETIISADVYDRTKDALGVSKLPQISVAGLEDAWPIHRVETLDLPS
jgi:photoactive yellow protein